MKKSRIRRNHRNILEMIISLMNGNKRIIGCLRKQHEEKIAKPKSRKQRNKVSKTKQAPNKKLPDSSTTHTHTHTHMQNRKTSADADEKTTNGKQ